MSTHRTASLFAALLGVVCIAQADDLYSPASYDALAADHRALRIGDNLTLVVT